MLRRHELEERAARDRREERTDRDGRGRPRVSFSVIISRQRELWQRLVVVVLPDLASSNTRRKKGKVSLM